MVNHTSNNLLTQEQILISFNYLNTISEGDKNFERQIIEHYLAHTPPCFKRLEAAVSVSNYKIIEFMSHKLRPSFHLMGIKENGILEVLEKAAINHEESWKIKRHFIKLKSIYEHSLVAIEKALVDLC